MIFRIIVPIVIVALPFIGLFISKFKFGNASGNKRKKVFKQSEYLQSLKDSSDQMEKLMSLQHFTNLQPLKVKGCDDETTCYTASHNGKQAYVVATDWHKDTVNPIFVTNNYSTSDLLTKSGSTDWHMHKVYGVNGEHTTTWESGNVAYTCTLPKGYSNTETESNEFNKSFSLYSPTDEEGFYIASPQVALAFNKLAENKDAFLGINFMFIGKHIYAMIDNEVSEAQLGVIIDLFNSIKSNHALDFVDKEDVKADPEYQKHLAEEQAKLRKSKIRLWTIIGINMAIWIGFAIFLFGPWGVWDVPTYDNTVAIVQEHDYSMYEYTTRKEGVAKEYRISPKTFNWTIEYYEMNDEETARSYIINKTTRTKKERGKDVTSYTDTYEENINNGTYSCIARSGNVIVEVKAKEEYRNEIHDLLKEMHFVWF